MLCPSTPLPLSVKMSEHSLQANDPRNGTTSPNVLRKPWHHSSALSAPIDLSSSHSNHRTLLHPTPSKKTKTIIIGSSWHHFSHSASYDMWLNISHYHLIFATSQNFTVDHCYNRQRNRYFQRGNKGNPSHAGTSIIPNTGLRFFHYTVVYFTDTMREESPTIISDEANPDYTLRWTNKNPSMAQG